jgi:hypothetical protein
MSIPELLEFATLAATMVGYALGWRHPALGAAVVLIAITLFNIVELAVNASIAGGMVNWLAIPGVLFLAAATAKRGMPAVV